MASKFKVGGHCECWCTRCKMTLEHVIIAMLEDKPARVQCLTCKSNHNYRLAPGKRKKQRGSKTPIKKRRTRGKRGKSWDTLISERDVSEARDYELSATFEEDELIDHGQFGVGIVLQSLPGAKIQVLFEQGAKTLAHGR